jgi:hypothetical protein
MGEPEMYTWSETNLSAAWSRAFLTMSRRPSRELSPFLVSIAADANGQPVEDEDLRQALDACLEVDGQQSVNTVANTIFPQGMWRRAKGDRAKLYKVYLENLPDFVSMSPRLNAQGLYFARLIGYGTNHKDGKPLEHLKGRLGEDGNQLEFIIKACVRGAMRMALQASVYDPVRDQTEARQHFPCLQHVAFVPDFDRKTLSLNAFYAMQLLYVKAYGNWLGLMRLGSFVASQTGLRFEKLNCMAGIQKMTNDSRPGGGDLLDRLTDLARASVGGANGQPAPAEARS